MQLVIIDLVPALLSWEGRNSSGPPEAAAGALGVVGDLFPHFRLTAVADGDWTGAQVREALERLDLAPYFESIGTSAGFGPMVTTRVIRRIAAALRSTGNAIVVTGRPDLATDLGRIGIPAVLVDHHGLADVPDRIHKLAGGRLSP